MQIIVSQQNTLAYTWNVTAGIGTLVVSGENDIDFIETHLLRIKDVTQGTTFGLSATTIFSTAFVNGLQTFTWVFTNLPTGTVSADVLYVYLYVSQLDAIFLLSQYWATNINTNNAFTYTIPFQLA